MYHGSCLCNAVEFEYDDDLGPITYCHCSRCRKANGTAFAAMIAAKKSKFRFTKGIQHVKAYRTAEAVERLFCSECGSQILTQRDAMPDILRLRLGGIKEEITEKVSQHIFVGSKAKWDDILDSAPQYEERP